MDCKNIKENLVQYSLDDLRDTEKISVESHLESCSECRDYLAESENLWNLLEVSGEIEPDAEFLSNFWDKVNVDGPKIKPGFIHWIRNINLNWTLAGAMASIFLVSIITFGVFSTDTRNRLLMSTDERDELVLMELDDAIAKETSDVLSIYGPWDSEADVNGSGGVN
jgi:anti-sigma factor RsiW